MTSSSVRPVRASEAPATPNPPAAPAIGRATGKAILLGEHAVVYGQPALAIPLSALPVIARVSPTTGASRLRSALFTGRLDAVPDRLKPTATAATVALAALGRPDVAIDVRIDSTIPAERGVGSSAAVAAAVIRGVAAAFGESFDADTEQELIQQAERVAHVAPSGLDAHTVRATAPVWFHQGRVLPVAVASDLSFVIADSGVAGRTREAVAAVRALRDADPVAIDATIADLGSIATAAREQIAGGEAEQLGAGMTEAHRILTGLGVGDAALDHLVHAAERAGALGGKLTGGGRGGCVLVLARDDEHAADVAGALRAAGAAATWSTTVEATS